MMFNFFILLWGCSEEQVKNAQYQEVASPSIDDPQWEYLPEGQYVLAQSMSNVIKRYEFFGATDGVAEGFDLDNMDSSDGDEETCGHGDFEDPFGESGIDNQLAAVWSAVEPLIGYASKSLIQGAINEGRLLHMIEINGVDDIYNDSSIDFHFFRGLQDPEIGTFGYIAPDQTYYYDYDFPATKISDVQIVDGVVNVGPASIFLPIDILELQVNIPVERFRMRFEIHDDGTFTGLLSGAIHVENFMEVMLATDAREEALLVQPIFETNADIEKVGDTCSYFSMGIKFEGTTAFTVRDEDLD